MSSKRAGRRSALGTHPVAPVWAVARHEAELARHGYAGAEHLLVALTSAEMGSVSGLLADHGVAQEQAREVVQLVVGSGRGDGPPWDARTLLATLGIDLDEISRCVEAQFGPDAIHHLYASEVGWRLRPRGPLCGVQLSPQLKQAVAKAVGRCWDSGPPQLHERLLLGALDVGSAGLAEVLHELDVSSSSLRAAVSAELRIAS